MGHVLEERGKQGGPADRGLGMLVGLVKFWKWGGCEWGPEREAGAEF